MVGDHSSNTLSPARHAAPEPFTCGYAPPPIDTVLRMPKSVALSRWTVCPSVGWNTPTETFVVSPVRKKSVVGSGDALTICVKPSRTRSVRRRASDSSLPDVVENAR